MDPEVGISGEHNMDNGKMPFLSYQVVGKWFVNFQYECEIKVRKKKKGSFNLRHQEAITKEMTAIMIITT